MSFQATGWALDDAPTDNPTEVLVLVAMAERARKDGTGVYLSVASIARRARCSSRTVVRTIKSLEERELIREGDQSLAAFIPQNRRPRVWDLAVERRREDDDEHADNWGDNLSPQDSPGVTPERSGVTPRAPRGDTGVTQSVSKPLEEPHTPRAADRSRDNGGTAGRLVDQVLPAATSSTTRSKLILVVAARLVAGVEEQLIEAALAAWVVRPEWGVGMLDPLIDTELRRHAPAWAGSAIVPVEVQARRIAIDECSQCDDNGWADTGDGVARCTHPGAALPLPPG